MSKLFTPEFRVAFPNVEQPDKHGKYSITMLFDLAKIAKDPEQQRLWDALAASVDEMAIAKWGTLPAVFKKPFKKGDEQRNKETGAIYNGFEGMVTLNASSQTQPGLIDQDKNPIISAKDFYGGCYAHATINMFAWQHPQSGKGVSCGLQNIQKRSDGEPFGGKSKAEDDFGAIAAAPAATGEADSGLFS